MTHTRPDPHASYREHVSSKAEAVEEHKVNKHDLTLPWRNDDPYPDVILDSNGDEVASFSNNEDCDFTIEAVSNYDSLRAQLATARKALEEGSEILVNLMESIRKHGNYSPETTIQFIDQALQCFRPGAAKRDRAALNSGEQKQIEDWPYPEGNPTCAQDLK